MHLNDDELLEPNAQHKKHLSSCVVCQQRADNLSLIRGQLLKMPIRKIPKRTWESVKAAHELANDQNIVVIAKRPRLSWQKLSASLAASILLFVSIYNEDINKYPINGQNSKLAEVINKNNLLQDNLYKDNHEHWDSIEFASMRYQISQINDSIQSAYIQQRSETELLTLWEKKAELLQSFLNKKLPERFIKV